MDLGEQAKKALADLLVYYEGTFDSDARIVARLMWLEGFKAGKDATHALAQDAFAKLTKSTTSRTQSSAPSATPTTQGEGEMSSHFETTKIIEYDTENGEAMVEIQERFRMDSVKMPEREWRTIIEDWARFYDLIPNPVF